MPSAAVTAAVEEGEEGEPEQRARLRAERLARVNARVQTSLQESRDRELAELHARDARERAASAWGVKLEKWISMNQVRTLNARDARDRAVGALGVKLDQWVGMNQVQLRANEAVWVYHEQSTRRAPQERGASVVTSLSIWYMVITIWGVECILAVIGTGGPVK
eukprot:5076186-Pyramimonas_sp.AAC.1